MAKMVFRATPVTPAPTVRRRLAAAYRSGNTTTRDTGTASGWSESSWLLREGLDMSEVDDDAAAAAARAAAAQARRNRPGGKG
jgi:hypothetical protein